VTGTDFHIPTVETARLKLRAHRIEDIGPEAAFYASDRARFVGGPMTAEQSWRVIAALLGHWALRGYGYWAVEEKATGQLCGQLGLWFPEGWPEPEIGWCLHDHATGKGYASEGVRAARDYAYGTLGWTTAISLIDPGNTASARLAARVGATREGVFDHERFGRMDLWRHPAQVAA
jgi:RimJ/RimL family protein N-acetyltransferase